MATEIKDQYTLAAQVDELPPGRMKTVKINGHGYLLANVNGTFLATDDLCTHEDASLSNGALHGECVSCPLHGSRFNLRTGEALEEPAEINLKTYPVRVTDGKIYIIV